MPRPAIPSVGLSTARDQQRNVDTISFGSAVTSVSGIRSGKRSGNSFSLAVRCPPLVDHDDPPVVDPVEQVRRVQVVPVERRSVRIATMSTSSSRTSCPGPARYQSSAADQRPPDSVPGRR